MAKDGWLGIAMPEEYGGAGLGITEAAIMMQTVAGIRRRPVRRLGDPHQHLRAAPDRRARHRRAEAPLAAAADQGRGEGLLRRHRARRRPRHRRPEDPGRMGRQQLHRQRPQDVDHDGAAGEEDPAARPHHAAREVQAPHGRHQPVLHRPRPELCRDPRDREDGPQGGRHQRAVHRRPAGARRKT